MCDTDADRNQRVLTEYFAANVSPEIHNLALAMPEDYSSSAIKIHIRHMRSVLYCFQTAICYAARFHPTPNLAITFSKQVCVCAVPESVAAWQ